MCEEYHEKFFQTFEACSGAYASGVAPGASGRRHHGLHPTGFDLTLNEVVLCFDTKRRIDTMTTNLKYDVPIQILQQIP